MKNVPELHVTTNYSFLRGASHPEEMFAQAAAYGIPALGVVDHNSVAGIVRAWEAAKTTGVRLVAGARLALRDGAALLAYPTDRPAWALEHLLFVCQHRGEEGRTLTFVHFEQPAIPGRIPRLSSFGWSEQSNNRTVLEHNLPSLRWPRDPKDAAAWLKQWQSAFDVEAVTKKFFTAYRDVFADVEKTIQGVPEDLKRNYTQRLFNRLLFLYFIQRKGWLEFQGNKNYLRALLKAAIANKENFLNDRLYWTFFYV